MRHAAAAGADGDRSRVTAADGPAGQGGDEIFPDLERNGDNDFLWPAPMVTRDLCNDRTCTATREARWDGPGTWLTTCPVAGPGLQGHRPPPATRGRHPPLGDRGQGPLAAPTRPVPSAARKAAARGTQNWRVYAAQRLGGGDCVAFFARRPQTCTQARARTGAPGRPTPMPSRTTGIAIRHWTMPALPSNNLLGTPLVRRPKPCPSVEQAEDAEDQRAESHLSGSPRFAPGLLDPYGMQGGRNPDLRTLSRKPAT